MKNHRSLPEFPCRPRAQQTGATLIVGLVLLLVLTVVGVSGMNTATMQISMAANTQYQQDAFQLAEDAIDIALAQKVYAPDGPRTVNWLGDPNYDRRAVTVPRDNMILNMAGSSVGVIRAFHWDVLAVGRGPRNSTSTHNQSFYVPANAN